MIIESSLRTGHAKHTALITGASGEIGRASAAALANAGYDLILQYHSNEAAVAETAAALSHSGVTLSTRCVDLSSDTDTLGLARWLDERGIPLDCVLHAATPPIHPAPALDVPSEEFLHSLSVHALSFARLARHALPLMQRQQRGVLIGLLSTAIEPLRPKRWWAYTSAKFALAGVISGLATDIEGSFVRALGLMPGGVATSLSRAAGVPQERLLSAGQVAAMVVRMAQESQVFPNGSIVKMEPDSVEVGRFAFAGRPLATRGE
jgi:3-oxoacyl-[acyl-carrier protein] reductase